MLVIKGLIWDENNKAHIARHGVTPDEVEEIIIGDPMFSETYGGRLRAVGTTNSGRVLAAILAPKDDEMYLVITARSASRRERRDYQQLASEVA